MLWFAAAKSAAAGILSARAGRQGSSQHGTGFPMAKQRRPRVCREHHRPDRKCMAMAAPGSDRCALHHLEAFTQQRALNRRRRLCGCGAQPDPGYRTCAWCRVWASWAKRRQRNPALRLDYRTTRFVAGCADHGNAARAAREAKLGTGLGARRVGYCLLQKPHVRAAIADLKAAILNRAHQRAEDEERAAALAREAELDRLARLELTALLEIEEAERELKMLMRMHHEVIAGGRRHRVGSQGGAQSRLARVCRQLRGEPAHREPGRCCCGQLATSPRGASCDYCRERNRHYRRRYRATVRRLRAV